jgi:hypothetical protein
MIVCAEYLDSGWAEIVKKKKNVCAGFLDSIKKVKKKKKPEWFSASDSHFVL